jgi:MYXO-CTERM domain-containing protein
VIDSTIIDSTVSDFDSSIAPVPDAADNPAPSGSPPSPGPDLPVIVPDAGRDASTPISLNGDTIDDTNSTLTGCTCRVGPAQAPLASIGATATTILAWLVRRRRSRRSRRERH